MPIANRCPNTENHSLTPQNGGRGGPKIFVT